MTRRAGILLHPTSLPGPRGIGDLGPEAHRFIDWLAAAGCRAWQILPLGPTGYADSPYQSLSSFSVNPLLISPDGLVADGLLEDPPAPLPGGPRVDYAQARAGKQAVLELAWRRFGTHHGLFEDYRRFCEEEAGWLDDDALFSALKERFGLRPWAEWPGPERDRDPAALAGARDELAEDLDRYRFEQWVFHRQWDDLRSHARRAGIEIIGDLPLYVAHDSSDTWVNRRFFSMEPDGRLITISGVPPDYFSETGQRWGNPTYRWDVLAAEDYRWWGDRLAATLDLVDVVRIDHFRGLADYWAIPAGAPTAATGTWLDGPGTALFDALTARFGDLPLIAEDLGDLSAKADALLALLPFPGMRVLQFAFDDRPEATPFDIDDIGDAVVVYTGTHDNETAVGWFDAAGPSLQATILRSVGGDGTDIAERLLGIALASDAQLAIAPVQDVLGLGAEARMNTPGTMEGNWQWRLVDGQLDDASAARLRAMVEAAGR